MNNRVLKSRDVRSRWGCRWPLRCRQRLRRPPAATARWSAARRRQQQAAGRCGSDGLAIPKRASARTVKADADGNYRFPFLPVGKYEVNATRNGAVLGKLADVTVALGNATTANVTLGSPRWKRSRCSARASSPPSTSNRPSRPPTSRAKSWRACRSTRPRSRSRCWRPA